MTSPRSDSAETLLARLVRDRHWTVEDFRRAYGSTSRALNLPNTVSDRQAKRWLSGAITSTPHPSACRVLREMFHVPVTDLLAPINRRYRDPEALTPPALPRQPPTFVQSDDVPQAREEVSPSRRRDLLGTGVVLAAGAATAGTAGTADATTRAAHISRAIATSAPDPLSLAQLQHGIQRLAHLYAVTPHEVLLGPVEAAWDTAEARLETRVSGSARRDLELLAGQYAYYRGQLAFDTGDEQGALTFFVLAGQHARAAGDPLLSGSIAVMRSALAFFAGEYTTAADIAAAAEPQAHPYIVPILAGSRARALALSGETDDALTALHTMNDHAWTGDLLPGPNPGDEEFCEAFSAVVLGYLRRGEDAEPHARRSLALLDHTGRYVQTAGTQLALARSFLHRSRPDPEQAATAARDAVVTVTGKEVTHGPTVQRAAGIWRHLAANSDWTSLPSVQILADRIDVTHRALPPSSAV